VILAPKQNWSIYKSMYWYQQTCQTQARVAMHAGSWRPRPSIPTHDQR